MPLHTHTVTTQPGLPCPLLSVLSVFHSCVAESVQVPAGVPNEGLMSSIIRRPGRSVREAPSPRRVVMFVCWTCVHYFDTRLHHTLISDTYTDCFYYTLINPFIIQPCVGTPVHVTRREPWVWQWVPERARRRGTENERGRERGTENERVIERRRERGR